MRFAIFSYIKILYITILLNFLCFSDAYSQEKLRYQDIYETLNNQNKKKSYSLLLEFSAQNPEHVNASYQLGLIFQEWTFKADPITNIEDATIYAEKAMYYLKIAKSKLTENEANTSSKYYRNILSKTTNSKLTIDNITSDINNRIQEINNYLKYISILNKYFTQANESYNNSIKIYKNIVSKISNLQDLYLLSNEEHLNKMQKLKNNFDIALTNYKKYKDAAKADQINTKEIKIALIPIKQYRLDGLWNQNQSGNKIKVWNYNKWIAEFEHYLSANIVPLRQKIKDTDDLLNSTIFTLENLSNYSNSLKVNMLNSELKLSLRRYDPNSVILKIFEYKEAKIKFLIRSKNQLSNIDNYTGDTDSKKLFRYFAKLTKDLDDVDSLRIHITKKINKYEVSKYNDFIESNYYGIDGLLKYFDNEKTKNNELQQLIYKKIKTIYCYQNNITDSIISIKNKKIYIKSQEPDFENSNSGDYYTVCSAKNENGAIYITGFVKPNNKHANCFAAKIENSTIIWLKLFDGKPYENKDFFHTGIIIKPKQSGCYLFINSQSKNNIDSLSYNTLVELNQSGDIVSKKEIKNNLMPVFLSYNQINDDLITIFQGQKDTALSNSTDQLIINISKQQSENLTQKLEFDGNIIDLLEFDGKHLIICNFTKIKNPKTKENLKTQNNNSFNQCFILLNANWEIEKIQSLQGKRTLYAIKSIKLSSKSIAILGFANRIQNNETCITNSSLLLNFFDLQQLMNYKL